MKPLFLVATLVLLFNAAFAQQSLTQNFNPAGNSSILVNLKNNNFSVKQWKNATFGIEIEIKINQPKAVVDQLVKINRYKITGTVADGKYTLNAADLNKAVTVGGVALTENISIVVQTPALYTNKGTTILKDPSMKSIKEPIDVVVRFVYADPPASTGVPGTSDNAGASKSSSGDLNSPEGVQAKYGDIIISGMKLDDFYD